MKLPPAAAHLDPFVAARQLRLAQRIERPGRALGVGDAVRRTIVLETDAPLVELPTGAWREATARASTWIRHAYAKNPPMPQRACC